jgi:imidazolonepropionase-like amidohydrolase
MRRAAPAYLGYYDSTVLKLFAFLLLLPALAAAQTLAIRDVTVIDVAGGAPRPGMTVLVEGERIAAIGSEVAVPEKAQVVQAAGKFLIPGLWDMHVHWQGPPSARSEATHLPLFTVNGVTGVRMMAGQTHHLDWRRQIAAGKLIGPRMVLAGIIIDGPQPYWKSSFAAATGEQGRYAVQQTKVAGFDFVKVYDSLPRDVFFAIAEEAKKQGLPVAGHVPAAVTPAEASDAGLKSIEHLTGMLLALSSEETELRRQIAEAIALAAGPERAAQFHRLDARVLDTYDAAKAAALYAKFKANGTWQVPTFTVLHANLLEPGYADDPRLKLMPAWVRAWWAGNIRGRTLTAEGRAAQKRFFERRVALVGEMHRAGVGILAGSDVLNPYCFPGFSLHDELEWLVKAGLSPLAALQAATRNPAVYLGRADLGAIEPGKLADLVLLDADPTQDIRNTRKIAAVVQAGKLYPRATLNGMIEDVERLANAN